MILCVCNCFLLYNYFLITIFLSKNALCSHFLSVCIKQKARGVPAIYSNMSHSRKKLSNIHSNKFHKLTICNCAYIFMVSWYRIAMGIEKENWRLYGGFSIILQTYPCRGIFKNLLDTITFIKKQNQNTKIQSETVVNIWFYLLFFSS
jgi:hypothetical protein